MSKFKVGDKVVENCQGFEKFQVMADKVIATVLEVRENGEVRLDVTDIENNCDWFDENDIKLASTV
jgi:aldehyde:ferredoxin oxidoreductase